MEDLIQIRKYSEPTRIIEFNLERYDRRKNFEFQRTITPVYAILRNLNIWYEGDIVYFQSNPNRRVYEYNYQQYRSYNNIRFDSAQDVVTYATIQSSGFMPTPAPVQFGIEYFL